MTDLAMDGLMRELTSEELALIAGGSIPGSFGSGERQAKQAGTDVRNFVKNDVVSPVAHGAGDVAGFFKGLF